MTPFEAYREYLALKQHFTRPEYSYHKYNGKVNVKPSSFESRRDRYYFEKLAKRRDASDFMLANLAEDPKIWVGELVSSDRAEERYRSWQRRNQSLTYAFKEELGKLDPTFDSNFVIDSGNHPLLIRLYLRKEVSLETLIILVHLTKCFGKWNKAMEYDPIWREISTKIVKYQPFMNYDLDKFRKIVIDIFG